VTKKPNECVYEAIYGLEKCYKEATNNGEDEFNEVDFETCIDGQPDPCGPFKKIITDEFPGVKFVEKQTEFV